MYQPLKSKIHNRCFVVQTLHATLFAPVYLNDLLENILYVLEKAYYHWCCFWLPLNLLISPLLFDLRLS